MMPPLPTMGKQNKTVWLQIAAAALMGTAFLSLAGCARSNPGAPAAASSVSKTSSIRVTAASDKIQIQSPAADFELSLSGYLKAVLRQEGQSRTLDDPGNEPGQRVIAGGKQVSDLALDLAHPSIREAAGKLGSLGKHIEISGTSSKSKLAETLAVEIYDDFPGMALLSASFRNTGTQDIQIQSVSVQEHRLSARASDPQAAPHDMWSFFGSSLKWGKDEVLRIPAEFSQENPLSLPIASDGDLGAAGGGIPVVAFWSRNVGLAIGHIETLPLVLSLPVKTLPDGSVSAGVQLTAGVNLKPGEIYSTPRTFVAVYHGDYYQPLSQWSKVLEREGLSQARPNQEDYAVSWCSWGYKANVTEKQMLEIIPKLKDLGIHWATLDDRWYDAYGDWRPRPDTFPGDTTQRMVKQFHDQGIKIQIWWLPLAVEDGHYGEGGRKFIVSDVVKQHPDWLILDEQGKPARMTRNLAALCPALPEVQAYYKQLTERFIRDWDFDGHKLDNIFAVPRCFNPKHHHKSPDDSVVAMGEVYRQIYETTRGLKADSVTQSCPCGTPPSLAWFRYMDQGVTADPISSLQVRRRIKMYKALLGPRAAIYGDHVELTRIIDPNTPKARQLGVDFASTLGTGGVPGTKFTLAQYQSQFPNIVLSREKEAHWKKWIGIYNDMMLSKGEFLDLYTYGVDEPEAYVIAKDGSIFYAFYTSVESPVLDVTANAKSTWKGQVELRGLQARSYTVADYVNNRKLGSIQGPTARLSVEFRDSLLLQATPTEDTGKLAK
jgi:alpha-galactosidase